MLQISGWFSWDSPCINMETCSSLVQKKSIIYSSFRTVKNLNCSIFMFFFWFTGRNQGSSIFLREHWCVSQHWQLSAGLPGLGIVLFAIIPFFCFLQVFSWSSTTDQPPFKYLQLSVVQIFHIYFFYIKRGTKSNSTKTPLIQNYWIS